MSSFERCGFVCQLFRTIHNKKLSAARVQHSCRNPGSNQGPLDLQSNALPTELFRPTIPSPPDMAAFLWWKSFSSLCHLACLRSNSASDDSSVGRAEDCSVQRWLISLGRWFKSVSSEFFILFHPTSSPPTLSIVTKASKSQYLWFIWFYCGKQADAWKDIRPPATNLEWKLKHAFLNLLAFWPMLDHVFTFSGWKLIQNGGLRDYV